MLGLTGDAGVLLVPVDQRREVVRELVEAGAAVLEAGDRAGLVAAPGGREGRRARLEV